MTVPLISMHSCFTNLEQTLEITCLLSILKISSNLWVHLLIYLFNRDTRCRSVVRIVLVATSKIHAVQQEREMEKQNQL